MSVKMRQEVERKIAQTAITQLLASGFVLGVFDGEETVLTHSNDAAAVLAAMFTTDEDELIVSKPGDAQDFGWVKFIYGNDGWDVIHDYTTNLETFLTEANKLADHYDD